LIRNAGANWMAMTFISIAAIIAIGVFGSIRNWPQHLCTPHEPHGPCFRQWLSALSPIIALLLALWIALPQMEAARKSADAAKKSLDLAADGQRAWLNPTMIILKEVPTIGNVVKVDLIYTNSGREPASNISQRHELRIVEGELVRNVSYEFQMPAPNCDGVVEIADGIVVYPTTSAPLKQYQQEIDPTLFANPSQKAKFSERVMNKTTRVVATGCFAYHSVNRSHISAYCYWLDYSPSSLSEPWLWRTCDSGHKAT
jgi:hypothetical protein